MILARDFGLMAENMQLNNQQTKVAAWDPHPFGARRRACSGGAAAPRRCHPIAWVAAPRSLSENYRDSRAWGLRGELKARGGGDVQAHRRRRATRRSPAISMRPSDSGGAGASAALALLDDVATSPASRRLASAPASSQTRPPVILGQAPDICPPGARAKMPSIFARTLKPPAMAGAGAYPGITAGLARTIPGDAG